MGGCFGSRCVRRHLQDFTVILFNIVTSASMGNGGQKGWQFFYQPLVIPVVHVKWEEDLGHRKLIQLEGVRWTSACSSVVVEEDSYSERFKEQETIQNLSVIPVSLRTYVCVCQDHQGVWQLQTKMQVEDVLWLCWYSEPLCRRKLCCHHRSRWTAQVNAIWQILWFKTFNEHWCQMFISKSEACGQPEGVLVTFEEQSDIQNVTHGNESSLTRKTFVKVSRHSSRNIWFVWSWKNCIMWMDPAKTANFKSDF